MYKAKSRAYRAMINTLLVVFTVLLCIFLIPQIKANRVYSVFYNYLTVLIVFCVLSTISSLLKAKGLEVISHNTLQKHETALLDEFISKMRFCYSLDDFYEVISDVLEIKGDCSVLYIDKTKDYVLYNSPNRITCSNDVMHTLHLNYNENWNNGYFFIGENYGVVTSSKQSRGFFLSSKGYHLYVFCKYTKLFDTEIFPSLYEEFVRFQSRTNTITSLSEIASLSKEWQQLADTQQSFLPPVMPKIDKLSVAAYYRPLVNVSGDYYTVLPISPTKTLLMLGDVSGKGLAAALVMGLVMNTVKSLSNKEDLPAMIKAVDKAIKGMKLQDKYTVVFIGIVDTEKMTIRYVNASMSDPLIITRAPTGYRIKPLTSNCSLVGILPLDEVDVAEQRLFRGDVILMASDGVSEVMDANGVELGDTELYDSTIKKSASKTPKEFIDDVVNLILTYNGGKKLRDDVTMMVAKVEG